MKSRKKVKNKKFELYKNKITSKKYKKNLFHLKKKTLISFQFKRKWTCFFFKKHIRLSQNEKSENFE